jgi:hypothetical protein
MDKVSYNENLLTFSKNVRQNIALRNYDILIKTCERKAKIKLRKQVSKFLSV